MNIVLKDGLFGRKNSKEIPKTSNILEKKKIKFYLDFSNFRNFISDRIEFAQFSLLDVT